MTITVLLFAQARELAGESRVTLELPEGARGDDVRAAMVRAYPGLAPLAPHLAVAVNGALDAGRTPVPRDAEVALLPPVSGG